MYRGFNLSVSWMDLNAMNILEYARIGEEEKNINKKKFDEKLFSYIENGVIDGTKLSEEWFEQSHYDVFISHSHKDYDLAMAIAGWLKKKFNLFAFVDAAVWGNYADLLKTIENECSKNNKLKYDYQKSASYVHAMLTTSLLNMMNQTEAVFFINTENSLPNITSMLAEEKYTESPWIYQELVATTLLKERSREVHRKRALLEFYEESELKIAFKAPLEALTPINFEILKKWEKRFCSNTKGINILFSEEKPYKYALDYLYDIVFGRDGGIFL